jgi:hypothetical protein
MSRVRPEDQPKPDAALYMSDQELIALFGCGEKKARAAIRILEKQGLPLKDPLIGKRYFPAVTKFLDRRHGVEPHFSPSLIPDGKEEWDG